MSEKEESVSRRAARTEALLESTFSYISYLTYFITAFLLVVAFYASFLWAPEHEVMGRTQRIFYGHVGFAWIGYLAFGLTVYSSVRYLLSADGRFDVLAGSFGEIGMVFCTGAIMTGSLWAKSVWGVYWRWEDMKLFSTFILWMVFGAFLFLRKHLEGDERPALSAVFSLFGALSIFLSFAANRIWSQYHPTVIASSGGSLRPEMGVSLGITLMAFTALFIIIQDFRRRLASAEEKISSIKREVDRIG